MIVIESAVITKVSVGRTTALAAEKMGTELIRRGAHYAGYSAFDKRGVGYDVSRQVLILANQGRAGTHFVEYPLADVRNVSWEIPGAETFSVFGNVGVAAALQVQSQNAAAMHLARADAGLRFDLADIQTPSVTVNLDADEGRMRSWYEIMGQAFEGRLRVLGSPVYV